MVADARSRHSPAVLANRLRFEHRWGRPCLAYHACVRPGPSAAAAFSAFQESMLRLEPSLLRVPVTAMHSNLVWLLPAREEFDQPKDELWRRHGSEWIDALAGAARSTRSFRLRYRHVVATDAAIIAVADAPNGISTLRHELAATIRVPGNLTGGELVHTTLFRYATPLRDPPSILRWIAVSECHVDMDVSELLIVRERVYPSLEYHILERLPLLPGDSG
jgi:hypothetical protein